MPPITMKEKFAFSAGRSAPQTFKDNYFDYNFAKFLGLTTYSGAEIGECFETAHRIIDGDVDSWTSTWLGTARRVEALADKALEGGHKISAREAYLRATTYYQASFFFILDKDPLKAEVYKKHVSCFAAAGTLFDPPFESILIPFEGRTLPGHFLRVDDKPRPTVLIQMGADGSSEQMYFSGGGAAALRRGYNALMFEGPGQTGAFMRDRSLTYRHDWEVPVKAVVDYALTRPEVDPARIALIAYSMGGYLGPRAVAFEKRIAACIVSGLVPSFYKMVSSRSGPIIAAAANGGSYNHAQRHMLYEHMPKYSFDNGIEDFAKADALLQKMELYGLEDKITCPLLVLQAAAEGEETTQEAREFFTKLPNPKNKFILTTEDEGAEMHCQKGNASFLHALEFDWLEEIMA
jgi:dipeptidyl aminopeptidase/acylaminoacyl peptidase